MEKMLNAMLNAQKEMALEKNATEVELEIIAGVLEEVAGILQDLISECKFEEAKGFLNDCSKLQQRQEELETLLANKQSDYTTLVCMVEEAKRLVSKYKADDTEREEEEKISSLEDLFAAVGFFSMQW